MGTNATTTANELDLIAESFKHLANIYRGVSQDLTGFGQWRILCHQIERVMDCKIITQHQYEAFERLSEAEFERLGGKKKY